MRAPLAPQTNFESLRKQAKQWLKTLRSGDGDAHRRLASAWPGAPSAPTLRDVQHALARELGFDGWIALSAEVEALALSRRTPDDLAQEVLRSAWGGDVTAAQRILSHVPELARHNLALAVMCGEADEVRRRLKTTPAGAKFPPLDWEPLQYLAYGRLAQPQTEALAIAHLLLEHGGDARAQFDDGWSNMFGLITGVIGQGEGVKPEHPHAEALAALFIEQGADPFDAQSLYNTSIVGDDVRWLDFVWSAVAAQGGEARWAQRQDSLLGKKGIRAIDYLLGNAVAFNHPRRAKWLLDHGANANAIHGYSGRPLIVEAQLSGHSLVADLLTAKGATLVKLSPAQAFQAACLSEDIAEARRLAKRAPAVLHHPGPLHSAAQRGLERVAAFLLDMGVSADITTPDGRTALHWAGQCGAVFVAQQLIAAGAEIDRRGSPYDATGLSFAVYFKQEAMIDLLTPLSRDVFSLARAMRFDRLETLLSADPALIHTRNRENDTLLFALPDDEDAAVRMVELLLEKGADPLLRNSKGQSAAEAAHLRGLDEAAEALETGIKGPDS